jgi:hypothetical protein
MHGARLSLHVPQAEAGASQKLAARVEIEPGLHDERPRRMVIDDRGPCIRIRASRRPDRETAVASTAMPIPAVRIRE